MGLMDILNGMQNGPRGRQPPGSSSGGSGSGSGGGLSPLTMALIGLLAYKALKSFSGGRSGAAPPTSSPGSTAPGKAATTPASLPGSAAAGDQGGLGDILGEVMGGKAGGLGDILGGLLGGKPGASPSGGLPGGLGSLLAGAGAGGVLSGGLGSLLKDFADNGQGSAANSWVGTGPNEEIEPDDLAKALGADAINALTRGTGLSRDELLEGMSQQLPELVDKLTPHGRLPTVQEASHW